MKNILIGLVALGCVQVVLAGERTVDLESLSLSSESYWNGSSKWADAGSPQPATGETFNYGGGFADNDVTFSNNYSVSGYSFVWGGVTYEGVDQSWSGFAYSNRTDTTEANATGMNGQYTAITGGGVASSDNYAVAYGAGAGGTQASLSVEGEHVVSGAYFTNTCWAYYSMQNGDQFAKKFGGDTGSDQDWFKLIINGIDANGATTGSVEFYLADFRSDDNSQDYIVDQWTWVDLASLGSVAGLEFTMESSDTGTFGINTPTYFAMDSMAVQVPEPISMAILSVGGLAVLRRRKA